MQNRTKALVISGPLALGAAAGWVTGLTETNSAVVAAVLPVVLTGVGGALLAFKLREGKGAWTEEAANTSGFVVLFTIALVLSLHGGLVYKESAEDRQRERERETMRTHLAEDIDFRMSILLKCAKNESIVNAVRKEAGQTPLPFETICARGVRVSTNDEAAPAVRMRSDAAQKVEEQSP